MVSLEVDVLPQNIVLELHASPDECESLFLDLQVAPFNVCHTLGGESNQFPIIHVLLKQYSS